MDVAGIPIEMILSFSFIVLLFVFLWINSLLAKKSYRKKVLKFIRDAQKYAEKDLINTVRVLRKVQRYAEQVLKEDEIRYLEKTIADLEKQLLEETGAPVFERAVLVKKGGFKDYDEYVAALKVGADTKEKYNLVLQTGAPNVDAAFKTLLYGFKRYEDYAKTKTPSVKFYSKKQLLERTGAPSLEEAQKVVDGGFPDYKTYLMAKKEGFNSFKEYEALINERQQILSSLSSSVDKISINEFMRKMKFKDRNTLLEWLYNLPEDMVFLDGEMVVFREPSKEIEILGEIDRLMEKFAKFEKQKKGKI